MTTGCSPDAELVVDGSTTDGTGADGGGTMTDGGTGGSTTGGEPRADGGLTGTTTADGESTAGGTTGEAPSGTWTEVIEAGVFATAEGAGMTADVLFDVGEDVTSIHISAYGHQGVSYAVDNLRAPDGNALIAPEWYSSPFNAGGPTLCIVCPNRTSSGESAVAALIPNTPEIALIPGTYSFRIHTFTQQQSGPFSPPTITPVADEVTVEVALHHDVGGRPETGLLNLNLHFTGAEGLNAAAAQTDARLQEALADLTSIYASVGVTIGDVNYLDMDVGLNFVETMTGPGNDFEALARATEGAPDGVNLIFVRDITEKSSPLAGFGVILGVAGGIPGPAVQGTGRSAVLIALDTPEMGDQSPKLGHTMAHEVGHYLGLFHSSEIPLGGSLHDPLPDTPENDQNNLMFYSGAGGTLSPDQGFVIRNNAWVHHLAAE